MGKCKHIIFIESNLKTKENFFMIIRSILGIYFKIPQGIIDLIHIPFQFNL
jgi:hypothetical protein